VCLISVCSVCGWCVCVYVCGVLRVWCVTCVVYVECGVFMWNMCVWFFSV